MMIDTRDKHVVLGKLKIIGNIYYKLYNTVDRIFSVIEENDLKDYNIINGRVLSWTECTRIYRIETKMDINECIKYLLSNKSIPKSPEISNIWTDEVGLRNKYALIGKNINYGMGINFYGKTKLFLLDIIERMSIDDLKKNFIMLDIDYEYYEKSNARMLERYINALDDKSFRTTVKSNKETDDILKINTINNVMGCNYVIGTDGKLYIKDNSIETNINIRNFPHKHFMLANNGFDKSGINIRSLKIDKGPEVLDKYGMANLNKYDTVEISLPSTLKCIRSYAFSNSNIEKIDLSRCEGLNEIGSYAFHQSGLVEICVPYTVEKLGTGVFYYCRDLKNVIFCNEIDIFKPNWLQGCSSLEYLVLPLKKMEGWDSANPLGIASLPKLKEIWTSKSNVWIAQEMAEVNYKEQKRLVGDYKKYNVMNKIKGLESEPIKPKVVIVKRRK